MASGLLELRNAVDDGLFTAHTSEPNWKLAHKILMPAFSPQAIRDVSRENCSTKTWCRSITFSGKNVA